MRLSVRSVEYGGVAPTLGSRRTSASALHLRVARTKRKPPPPMCEVVGVYRSSSARRRLSFTTTLPLSNGLFVSVAAPPPPLHPPLSPPSRVFPGEPESNVKRSGAVIFSLACYPIDQPRRASAKSSTPAAVSRILKEPLLRRSAS